MNTFERDFTKELEKCVQTGTADIVVSKVWSPSRVAPPEIHVHAGVAAEVPIESMYYQLRRNQTFQQINDLLGMNLSEQVLNTVLKNPVNAEKVQVWMFARWWFNSYAEYLLDPLTQRASFYKERHEEFLSLMRHMLEFQSTRRLTFRAALASWFPDSDLFTKEAQSEGDDASDDAYAHADVSRRRSLEEPVPHPSFSAPPPPPLEEPAPSEPPPVPPPATAQTPRPTVHRLVLKGWGGPAGRSKTRKNLGS